MTTISYTEFCTYSLSKKIDFFDNGMTAVVQSVEESKLYRFLKSIILNINENASIRKSAISVLVESVFLGKIKDRQAISILVDEWEKSSNIFVEVQRIKDLYYFFDLEPEIQEIYSSYLENDELEIVTEAQINLGFIHLQKGFESANKEKMVSSLKEAIGYFGEAYSCIENRIDARFYYIFSSILLDLSNHKMANIDNQLNQLSEVLKEKWLYSFDFKDNLIDVSFYRTLLSICNIKKENPANWIEYSFEFNKLYENYAEVKNQEIKKRLNKSNLSSLFVKMCNEAFIEPYFALNFPAQIVKIDNCISKYPKDSPICDFLIQIKKLAEDKDFKKKVDVAEIEQRLKNCFPERNEATIKKTVNKIKDPTNLNEILNAFEEINAPSIEKFIDALILAILKLQGDRIYKFSNKEIEENDRNKFIAQLLGSAGYNIKDQPLWGESPGGKKDGEIDLMYFDSRGLPFVIIEALNWRDWDYLKDHINKLFNNYDTAGFEYNFIIVYSSVKKFGYLCKKYFDYISKVHVYKYLFQRCEELQDYRYADLKVYQAEHIRQGNKIFLNHVIVNLSES